MKKTGLRIVLLISMLCAGLMIAGATQSFGQDLTMHSTTTSSGMMGRGGGTTNSVEYFSKNAIKTTSADGNDTIVRLDSEKFITIDNKKKTYSEMTFKQLQDMLNQAGAALSKMGSEQMEAMKKMMGSMDTAFSVSKTGAGESIAGYATDKYLVKGPIEMEIWSTPDLKIPSAYYDAMKFQAAANPMFDMKKLFEEMKKISGMPLKTVTTIKMMGNAMTTTKTVTSIEKGSIPASVFEIPAGYKLVEAKMQ
jgi:hypothetical protein